MSRPPRDANAEASAVRGRLAWVRSTFSPMMMASAASEGGEGTGSGGGGGGGGEGRSGSGCSPGAPELAATGSRSIAAQVVAAYSDILEELIADVAVEAHRAWRTGAAYRTPAGVNLEGPPPLETRSRPSVPQQQNQQVRAAAVADASGQAEAVVAAPAPPAPAPPVRLARVDAFGQPLKASSAGDVACPACGRRVAAARFAPHLEKCLGGGRAAGRARAAAR